MTRLTHPNLRYIGFQGDSFHLEGILSQVTIPHLEKFQAYFPYGLTLSFPAAVPHGQLISTLGNLRPNAVTLTFLDQYINLMGYPHKGARMYTSCMTIEGTGFVWQVDYIVDCCHVLRTVFSAVEHLTLKYDRHLSADWCGYPGRRQWRRLLGSFGSVKTLYVDRGLFGQLPDALEPIAEESPMELLPELQELSYPSSLNPFSYFIKSRQRAGCPVTIVHP